MQIADDPEQDLPVKDINSHRSGVMAPPPLSHSFEGRATLPNQFVSKLNRGELEDRFLNMRDENLHLKKVCNQHEEKIRRLAAKLLRVVCEQKDRLPTAERRRDYDIEKVVEEQEVRINELEQCNSNLQERLVVLRQQLSSHSRLHSAVHCTPPRCTLRSHSQQRVSSSSLHQNESFRESGRAAEQEQELSNLREQEHQLTAEVTMLRQEVQRLEQELRMAREESTARATELAEELASSAVEEQRQKVSENVELIRVKRVMKQQSAQILSLQTHNQALERELALVRESLEHSQHSNDDLHQEVLAEKQKVVELQQQVANMLSCQLAIKELKAEIVDHQKEKAALKDHNQQLLSLSANSVNVESNTGEDKRVSVLERTLAMERSELSVAKTSMEELKNRLETREEENKQLKASCERLESQLRINMPTLDEKSFGPDDKHMEADIITMAGTSESQHSIATVHPLVSGGDLELPFPTSYHEPASEEVSPPSVTSLSQVNHDVVNKMAATSSDNKIKLLSHLEAARELKKCQEMLRVQYNLNILYKKEVDNLGQKLYQCTLQNAVKHHKR